MDKLKAKLWSLKKILAYSLFGLGAIIIGIIILPLERLFIHPLTAFKRAGRRTISVSTRLFVRVLTLWHVLVIEKPLPSFEDLSGKIVAPNHPSLFDVVVLFSLIDGANCIIKGKLTRSVYSAVVRPLYINNSEDFGSLLQDCEKSLRNGDALIIFPEGTRTREGKPVDVKRGTAYISLHSGAPIVPFIIGGNDKKGLMKYDKAWDINDEGYYTYTLERLPEIDPSGFALPDARRAAINLTKHLQGIYRAHDSRMLEDK